MKQLLKNAKNQGGGGHTSENNNSRPALYTQSVTGMSDVMSSERHVQPIQGGRVSGSGVPLQDRLWGEKIATGVEGEFPVSQTGSNLQISTNIKVCPSIGLNRGQRPSQVNL